MDNQSTQHKLVRSAIELFSQKHYYDVSVADICRNSGLSNGVFYRYFRNKEALFTSLVEEFLDLIEQTFESLTGTTVEARLDQFIRALFTFTQREHQRVSIFREGQYRLYDYEKRLLAIYHQALDRIYERHLSVS